MAIETRKVPAEIVIRFSPHPSRGKVGTPLTWMFREALETTEDGKQIGYKELDPVDLTQKQAEEYFGKQMAEFMAGMTAERASHVATCETMKAEADEQTAALQAKLTEAQTCITALGGTEEGLRRAKEAKRQAAIEAKANADAALAELEAVA